jgi:glycosyltransferase involved in cell wall biosynthesis
MHKRNKPLNIIFDASTLVENMISEVRGGIFNVAYYERFGMPPLEAMQAGTPVICSNNSSLPEVVGDAAITIDCDSEEQCIKAFEDLYFNENIRKEYIARGIERAKFFSWRKTGKLMIDKILEIV